MLTINVCLNTVSARAKFYMDKEYVLKHYRIAERYLNIISGPIQSTQFSSIDELIDKIVTNGPALDKLRIALRKKVGAKLAPIEE
ncbi:MAG: hypothetical protein NWE86_00915 [Candidatus Bathyarchaeota archaeon]|nr:hypothetical protein [Candidatus Bathyarchaeota archaeon]